MKGCASDSVQCSTPWALDIGPNTCGSDEEFSGDTMDDLEKGDTAINFIPCLKWLRRGVAKAQPDQLKLTTAELAEVIAQTQRQIDVVDGVADDDDDADEDEDVAGGQDEVETVDPPADTGPPLTEDERINREYGLDDYEAETGPASHALGLGELIAFANPRQDPYVADPELDDDASDVEDVQIRPTDNLVAVGHVEGHAATLELYVYNDVEDAFYVHHDILLPSLPLAIEWLSYEPGEETRGNLAAIGYMDPVIDVWDLDVIDGLEPAYRLGRAAQKKPKLKAVGHKDAVLSLAWNHHVEYILASGSVDETVLLWDLSSGEVKHKLTAHKEKIQSLQWHPFEANNLLTGCCDKQARVFDCRGADFKAWTVDGEVERVLWNHFNPFTFLVCTDSGYVHMIDVRQDQKPLWNLQAHSEGINGMSLSAQCPDTLITASSDHTLKVWDITDHRPACILEKTMAMGQLQCLEGCPDAPFVVCVGGDLPANNLRVWDIREATSVRNRFGDRKLRNPLGVSEFGYPTLNEAEPDTAMDASQAMEAMAIEPDEIAVIQPAPTGGAVGKFKKQKEKKKKKKSAF
eukprot:maker-scaffold321_size207582-snap-gene-1.33 protein:Tk05197 transcript:maker-scaffold321_size207582-snap-gene-1.33-mRNA-1 annotation:"periodic tryptophan protein 1 homolog"